VIHYHPYTTKAVGKRAKLSIFLDVYDVELSTERLALPESQGGDVYDVDDYQCNGEDVEIKVVVWDSYTDTGKGTTYITDLADTRITNDGMVFAIAVVPVGTEVVMPPWASELPELGAADSGNVRRSGHRRRQRPPTPPTRPPPPRATRPPPPPRRSTSTTGG
jgi:hypothetical protein